MASVNMGERKRGPVGRIHGFYYVLKAIGGDGGRGGVFGERVRVPNRGALWALERHGLSWQ